MDQATRHVRYLACDRVTRPDAAGAPRKPHTKGLHAARPNGITAALSQGRLKAGRAAAPLCVVWRYPPSGGRSERPLRRGCVCAKPDAWAAETNGTRPRKDDWQVVLSLCSRLGKVVRNRGPPR